MSSEELNMQQRNALTELLAREGSPGGTRASIAALQAQLAQMGQPRPGPIPAAVAGGEQYLIFSLLEQNLAIKAEYIQAVERPGDVTPVPNVASWVRGVINLRGSIASVVDLRAFLNMEQLPYNPRTRLLSMQYNEMVICLAVDGVSEMIPIPLAAIVNGSTRQTTIPSWIAPYAAGSTLLNSRAIVLLDAGRLLFSDKMQHYSQESQAV